MSYIKVRAALYLLRLLCLPNIIGNAMKKKPESKAVERKEVEHKSTLGKKPSTPQHKGQLMSRVDRLLKNRGC